MNLTPTATDLDQATYDIFRFARDEADTSEVKLLHRAVTVTSRDYQLGIGPVEGRVVYAIVRSDGPSIIDIGDVGSVSHLSAMIRTIEGLES
jgi:hypothetical protein